MKLFCVSCLLFIACGTPLFAQNAAAPAPVDKNEYTFTQFGNETWDFVRQPAAWDAGDWLRVGLLGAGVFALMETADQPVRDIALRNPQYNKSIPIEFGRVWGELYSPVVLFGGFAIHSLIADDKGTRKIAYEIGQASIYAGVLTYILKMAIGRARPYTDEGPTAFRPFSSIFSDDHHSMPGGHNAAGFVLSTVLSRNVKPTWLKVAAYLPAALTFISRLYQDKHWLSDDFAGAALGYFVATWVVDQHESQGTSMGMTSIFPLSFSITF